MGMISRRATMKFLRNITLGTCLVAGVTYAETWNAKLLDASCAEKSATNGKVDKKARESIAKTCAAGSGTTAFAILTTAGNVYKLDGESNTKAVSALKAGSFDPDNDGDVHATIVGTLQGDTVTATSISGKGEKHKKTT
jgi:hypothetical protein